MASTVVDVKIAVDKFADAEPTLMQCTTKSSVIDQELNRYGMSRYHWMIWTICGSGFFLDIMWAQAFSLTSSNIQREFGFSDKEFGYIATAFGAGVTTGAFVWGALVDVVGRRVAFLGTSLISGLFGMCIGAQASYNGLLVILAFTGFGIGGNIPIDSIITVEYIPKDRFYLLTALSIFRTLGLVTCTFIAFWLIPSYSCSTKLVSCQLTGGVAPCCSRDGNMGWRYLFFTIASITLGVFIIRLFIFPFHESPRFLLSRGNDRAAVEVVHKIAAFNKRSCDLTVESLYEQCKETPDLEEKGFSKRLVKEISRLKLLFGSRRMVRVTIHICAILMFARFGYSSIVAYLPTILQRKNSSIHVSLRRTYVDYLIIYTPGIVAVMLSILMVRAPVVGRKWTLVFSSIGVGISLFLYSVVSTQASYIGFNALEYFFQCIFNAVLLGWIPEAFPTAVRGTATGMAAFLGSLLGISGPLIAAQLFSRNNGNDAVLYLAGSCLFASTISLLSLPAKDMVAPR